MTLKELKKKLDAFDENLLVGGSGHFGEILRIDSIYKSHNGFIVINIEYSGDEPD